MIRHAIPYAASSDSCCCPLQSCGGIIPDPMCLDHGARKNPAMEWHREEHCPTRRGQTRRYRCSRGHFLPATFSPPATDPDDWDDDCRCKPRRGASP